VVYCFEDDDVDEAARMMKENQIRRILVLNRDRRLVGIISLGDLAVEVGDEHLSGKTLEEVSEPAMPSR
jgi:predicted transcriptional regulator